MAPEPPNHEHRGWRDPVQVDEYVTRISRLSPRLAGEAMLVEVLPPEPRRVLDLGCGDGRLAALVMDECPSVGEVVAIDSSPPMLERARERFDGDGRVEVRAGDLRDPLPDLGGFDVVVSGFAIHHLADARKQELFGEIARTLRPAGVFANLEVVASATPELHRTFLDAIGKAADDPEDQLADVETQLGWMRAAGLRQVDCLWRWRGFALLVGSSPAAGLGEDPAASP
ncbi:MAG TPA: class I SAM-dependent methyltransferase [Acidimicrobiales bacterium]|nr:class I SAM-dependent methyltransferase [Acidimicrobiales bacterium]